MISRWFVRRRGFANSVAVSGHAIGQLVIVMALASLLGALGWRTSYAVLGAANLVVVVPLVLAAVRSRPPESCCGPSSDAGRDGGEDAALSASAPSAAPAPLRGIFASRELWLLILIYGICGFQDFFVTTHVVAFAIDQGMGSLLAGNVLALMGVLGLLGVLVSGFLSDAFGVTRPVVLCFVMRLPVFAFVLFVQEDAGHRGIRLPVWLHPSDNGSADGGFCRKPVRPVQAGRGQRADQRGAPDNGRLGRVRGAVIFDRWESYDGAFVLMAALAAVALAATLSLQRGKLRPS